MKFYPHLIALEILFLLNIDTNELYEEETETFTDKAVLLFASAGTLGLFLKKNARLTLARLKSSKNPAIRYARNLELTLSGSLSSAIMEKVESEFDGSSVLIKWITSSAHDQDPFHSLQYGKVMTLKQAKSLGLGIRFGCQCGFEFVKKSNDMKLTVLKKQLPKKLMKK